MTSTPPRTRTVWLPALLLVTFAVGTDDFVVAGALPAISHDLDVSESAAGQLVTVFSLAYALSAPVMAAATSHLPPRRVLVVGLAVFIALNLLTALAPSFHVLMVLRVVTAVVAGTLSPAAFALAGRQAHPDRVGQAIGVVAAGLTVSLAIGVPIGTWLSVTWGWRSTFVAVSVFSAFALVVVRLALPDLPGSGSREGFGGRLRPMRRPVLLACAGTTAIGACAGLMPYTYIAPITTGLTGESDRLTLFIATIGIAGAVGAALGGRLADAWGPDRGMIATFGTALAVTLLLAILLATVAPVPWFLLCALLAAWGIAAWANNAPMNARTLALAGAAGTQAMALNTSALYVGISVGAASGGLALGRYGTTGVLWTALLIGLAGLTVMTLTVRRWPSPTRAGDSGA